MHQIGVFTRPVTNGALGAVAANLIVVVDSANPGNVKQSTAAQLGFYGVTTGATDTRGYASIQTLGEARVVLGGTVTAGDQIASDANGKAVTQAVAASGAAVKQIIGIAMASGVAGDIIVVHLQPKITVQ